MIHSMVVDNSMFRQIFAEQDYDNIIVGTGVLAHDVYNKLLLLGLKVKCFVGREADHDNNIWHSDELLLLEAPECHHFLMCCETQEEDVYHFAKLSINRLLNLINRDHEQVIEVSNLSGQHTVTGKSRSFKRATDALNGKCLLCNSQAYQVLGDENDASASRIHIVGACNARGAFGYFPKSINEFLYELLTSEGFPCIIYAWGQNNLSTTDIIVQLIRDIRFFKIDLIIKLGSSVEVLNPVIVTERNMLSAFTNSFSQAAFLVGQIHNSYSGEINNGTNNDIDLISLQNMRNRILGTLANLYGFSFWEVFMPRPYDYNTSDNTCDPFNYRPKEANKNASLINNLIAALDSRYFKDYREAISIEEDMFSLYSDQYHVSVYGRERIAKLLADDILKEFAKG